MTKLMAIIALAGLLVCRAEGRNTQMIFNCRADNDLYSVLTKSGVKCARYDTASEAVENARPGTAVLILADGYPEKTTDIPAAVFDAAAKKNLRLFVEYPAAVPGLEIGEPQNTNWERGVVSSDEFGDTLPTLRILGIQECRYVPTSAPNPMIVVARIAGFDKAVYGIPANAQPILFEISERNLLVATTKLSSFVTGRYAPTSGWKTIWEHILTKLDPDVRVDLQWTPDVTPVYGVSEKLPSSYEKSAFDSAAKWFHDSRLLVTAQREPDIHKLLREGAEQVATPGPDAPVGDGSHGLLEGYASAIQADGNQRQRIPLRADCQAEAAMTLAMDGMINNHSNSRETARNLLDYIYFTSGMCKGGRGNPEHPAFGHIAWGDIAPGWLIANYGDDNARVLLGTMLTAACLDSDKWDEMLLRGLMANLRTTGPEGFRGDRIDMAQLEDHGWKYYEQTSRVNAAPHFESYLWACYLWAYQQTHYKPFLDKTKIGIRMTMDVYPQGWRWQDSVERSRMILCLAWLVRLEDTPEHRGWLSSVAGDLLTLQQPCGAIAEHLNDTGGAGHYWAPKSNEAYGTSETPLIQQNGDTAADQLYTTGFALIGLHEAYAATDDPMYKKAEDKLAEFLCRIQVKSAKHPYLNGAWMRAFDYGRWDYWASSGDLGWGAWSIESGWGNAWTGTVLGLRLKGTSFWDMTSHSQVIKQFDKVRKDMGNG